MYEAYLSDSFPAPNRSHRSTATTTTADQHIYHVPESSGGRTTVADPQLGNRNICTEGDSRGIFYEPTAYAIPISSNPQKLPAVETDHAYAVLDGP